ncbi:MAG: 4'-phosphopantetheinyl transferase superfamily protein [Myxococcota bacterium]|nr:4'-phosphopantetheinyl transferase superfamily protein [Myxococcota bacterium]
MAPKVAFDWTLDAGRCVGVWIEAGIDGADAAAEANLAVEERAFAARLAPARRRTWVGGRIAMREALVRSGFEPFPVLSDDRGAPRLRPGVAGSISHKNLSAMGTSRAVLRDVAVALVAREESARVGVDIEVATPVSHSPLGIAQRILTDDELSAIFPMSPEERAREILLRFSAKESLYKAIDPFVRRYVAFREVELTPLPDGSAHVRLLLQEAEGPFHVMARWQRFEGMFVTSARVDRC